MKTAYLLLLFFFTSFGAFGQEIFDLDSLDDASSMVSTRTVQGMYFSYDASGNRTAAYITVPLMRGSQDDGRQPEQSRMVAAEFRVGPSPTDGKVTVSLLRSNGETSFAVTVFNTSGQPVATGITAAASITLDITAQPKGIYIVEIEMEGDRQNTKITKK